MATKTNPILIIGAGISGLAAGRLLTNHGIPNIIFEASRPERSQGFSISLREWGYGALLSALGDLPLRDLTRGVAPDRHLGGSGWIDQALRDNTTGELLVEPEKDLKQNIVRANRVALIEWMKDCGEEELDVRHGHALKSFHGEIGNITAEFENGATYHGALLLACDGVHSKVRSLILPELKPDIVPVVVFHGEFTLTKDEFDAVIKPLAGKSNILAGVGDGFNTPITLCNLDKHHAHLDWSYSRPVHGDNDPLFRPNITPEEAKQIPQALLDEVATRNLAEPWSKYINPEAMKDQRVFNWLSRCVFTTREDVDATMKSGVVFLGDSWHAMPIFGGEGGNHAMVDSIELVQAVVDSNGDLAKAVEEYYSVAFKRCAEAVKRSRQRFFVLHRPMADWYEIARKRQV
ncbi:FAD-dependent monooxygenase [Jackrogersella minutella]|nr:FAD-dependent monooxygenase [Jackrogersella minutella]